MASRWLAALLSCPMQFLLLLLLLLWRHALMEACSYGGLKTVIFKIHRVNGVTIKPFLSLKSHMVPAGLLI